MFPLRLTSPAEPTLQAIHAYLAEVAPQTAAALVAEQQVQPLPAALRRSTSQRMLA